MKKLLLLLLLLSLSERNTLLCILLLVAMDDGPSKNGKRGITYNGGGGDYSAKCLGLGLIRKAFDCVLSYMLMALR